MKKVVEVFKNLLIISWSLIGIMALILIFMSIKNYIDIKLKQPIAEKTVQVFFNHYNNKDYDYIYNNLADAKYKEITSKEENKNEILSIYKKYGSIINREKGYLSTCSEDRYCYYITVYQKNKKNKFEVNYTFVFFKKNIKDNVLKLYGYRAENVPVDKWNQYND